VAKKELVVVVPKQRPFNYTFSLHTQFFPYAWSLRAAFGPKQGSAIRDIGGDWFYYEPSPGARP
jgi:hypothetical protein